MHTPKPRPPHLKTGRTAIKGARNSKAGPSRDSPDFLVRLVGARQAKALAAQTIIRPRRD